MELLFLKKLYRGIFGIFFVYFIQHCFIFRPSDSTVSEDAGIDPKGCFLRIFLKKPTNSIA